MTTDYASSFEKSMIKMVGYDMTVNAAKKVYEQAGLGPEDVRRVSSCTTASPPTRSSPTRALGLCEEGEAEKFIWDGDNTYGGKCRDQPVGRAALEGPPARRDRPRAVHGARVAAPRQADKRQVQDAKVALQHNLGLGGACVVTMYRRD